MFRFCWKALFGESNDATDAAAPNINRGENNNNNNENNTSRRRAREIDSVPDDNNNTNEMIPPQNNASSTITLPVIDQVVAVLRGAQVTFRDPRNGKTATIQLSPRLAAGFSSAIVAAGREILLQQKCRNWKRMNDAQIKSELEQLTDEVECVRAVAGGLIQLHSKLNDAFAKANTNHFGSFAESCWTRTLDVSRCFWTFSGFLTAKSFNDNSQSVVEILQPLLDIGALQTIADVALTRTRNYCDDVGNFGPFADNMEKAGCIASMSSDTADIFCRRLVAVPALQKCRFIDASPLVSSTSGTFGEPTSELLNNVSGSSGSGKTLNSMLYAASWNPHDPGVTLLLDIKEDIFPFDVPFLDEADPFEAPEATLQRLSCPDESSRKARDIICAAYLVKAVARALGSSKCVDIPDEQACVGIQLEKFLTDNFISLFANLRIGKKFVGKVVIVVDEIGSFPWFRHGLCSVWKTIRSFLKEHLYLESESQLFLIGAGTGSENMVELGVRPSATTYSIFTVDAPNFFPEALKGLAASGGLDDNDNVKRWAETIFDLLYHERRTSSEFEYPLKQTNLDSRTSYFARIVTYNSRCAALALQLIIEAAASDQNAAIKECFLSKCSEWTTKIIEGYCNLNCLNSLTPRECCSTFARAIRAVMLHQKNLFFGESHAFRISYGLLEDRARIVSKVDHEKHELIENISDDNYLVVTKGTPRYHISETFVAMFLWDIGVCNGANNFTHERDLLELASADHHALIASLCFSSFPVSDGIEYTPLPEPSKSLAASGLKPFVHSSYRAVERFYCQGATPSGNGSKWLSPTHPEQPVWDEWGKIIKNRGCVVIVNGKSAPFADVIVLAPGRVFLARCTNYDSSSTVDTTEDMLTCRASKKLCEKLATCCQVDKKVEFIATNVVLSTMTKVDGTIKSAQSRKVSSITWSFVQTPAVFVLDEEQNSSIYSSFLYPVLCTRIKNKSSDEDENDDDREKNEQL